MFHGSSVYPKTFVFQEQWTTDQRPSLEAGMFLWQGTIWWPNSLEWFQRIYGTTISGWSWASWVLERTKFVGPWIHFVQFCVGCSAICVAEFPKLMLLHIYVWLFLPVISCYLLGLCRFPCLGSCYPQSRSIGYHNVSIYIYMYHHNIYIYIYSLLVSLYSFRISLRQYRLKPAVVPFKNNKPAGWFWCVPVQETTKSMS